MEALKYVTTEMVAIVHKLIDRIEKLEKENIILSRRIETAERKIRDLDN